MKTQKETADILILRKGQEHYPQALKKLTSNPRKPAKNPDAAGFFKELWRVHKKRIEKPIRKPLGNITNLTKKPYLEDNFEVLGFLNRQSQDLMFFRCFDEKDLKIPEEFSKKTISHTLDNDVTTDEEQVKSAIRNLKNAVMESLEKKKKPPEKDVKPKILLIR